MPGTHSTVTYISCKTNVSSVIILYLAYAWHMPGFSPGVMVPVLGLGPQCAELAHCVCLWHSFLEVMLQAGSWELRAFTPWKLTKYTKQAFCVLFCFRREGFFV